MTLQHMRTRQGAVVLMATTALTLGSATTDFSGHFLISYLRDDFEKTPLSPWGINFELVGGPDVYFSAELGGSTILQETQGDGRKPGRQNECGKRIALCHG